MKPEENKQPEQRERKIRQKHARFKMPKKFPYPVKALWEAAAPQDREKAHQVGVVLLEVWLGRISREDGAKKLGIPPLRLWQMSQQAVAGMVAGLLKQPRMRGKMPVLESARALEKQVKELERKTQIQQELIELLRGMPGEKIERKQRKKREKKKEPSQEDSGPVAEAGQDQKV